MMAVFTCLDLLTFPVVVIVVVSSLNYPSEVFAIKPEFHDDHTEILTGIGVKIYRLHHADDISQRALTKFVS